MILRPFGKLRAQERRGMAGATLLEILVAMIIIGLVSTGLITAFIFGRRMTLRSGTELFSSGLVTETTEALRGPLNGLTLVPGIYADGNMLNPPAGVSAPRIAGLNFPPDFRRFQDQDSGVSTATVALANHGDGRLVVVENAGQDLDGDGQSGVSFDGGLTTALRRVRVRVKWTSPTT